MNATVLSDGAWGTALALLLRDNGHRTTLWGPFPDHLATLRETRENRQFLPGVPLPDDLVIQDEMADAVDQADVIVLASPSQFLRGTLARLKPFHRPEIPLVNVAKGIEVSTLKRMSEVCAEILGDHRYAALSGPSHAEEVARQAPTAVVVASTDPKTATFVRDTFMNDMFRVYTSDDVVGVELGGSLKNVFAIAAGIIDGLGLGDNAKAALVTRGAVEMARLGSALGGAHQTFSGLSGIGDLIVTCCSGHSRNRHVGEELGRGKKLDDIIRDMGMVVAEGVKTTQCAFELSRLHHVETPIVEELYAILQQGKNPRQAVKSLMNRKAKSEREAY